MSRLPLRQDFADMRAKVSREALPPSILQQLEQALADLQYGSVQLVVHEAQIVRIERLERIRLTGSPEAVVQLTGRPTISEEARHEEGRGA